MGKVRRFLGLYCLKDSLKWNCSPPTYRITSVLRKCAKIVQTTSLCHANAVCFEVDVRSIHNIPSKNEAGVFLFGNSRFSILRRFVCDSFRVPLVQT